MKIKFLLLGTGLSFLPLTVNAQCVATQDCATLGYTETSCNGGKGVKCPFGNKWACLATEESVCTKNGFKYTCTGTGYSGGSGDSCGGKYKKCSCKSGYKWDNGSCKKSCSSSYKYSCSGTGYSGGSGSACDGKYTQCNCANGYEWTNGSCQKESLNGAQGDFYYCNGEIAGIKISGNFYVNTKSLGSKNLDDSQNACSYSVCSGGGRLPSKEEALIIYQQLNNINRNIPNSGDKIPAEYHWTSSSCTDGHGTYPCMIQMSSGTIYGHGFYGNRNGFVRCIW